MRFWCPPRVGRAAAEVTIRSAAARTVTARTAAKVVPKAREEGVAHLLRRE